MDDYAGSGVPTFGPSPRDREEICEATLEMHWANAPEGVVLITPATVQCQRLKGHDGAHMFAIKWDEE